MASTAVPTVSGKCLSSIRARWLISGFLALSMVLTAGCHEETGPQRADFGLASMDDGLARLFADGSVTPVEVEGKGVDGASEVAWRADGSAVILAEGRLIAVERTGAWAGANCVACLGLVTTSDGVVTSQPVMSGFELVMFGDELTEVSRVPARLSSRRVPIQGITDAAEPEVIGVDPWGRIVVNYLSRDASYRGGPSTLALHGTDGSILNEVQLKGVPIELLQDPSGYRLAVASHSSGGVCLFEAGLSVVEFRSDKMLVQPVKQLPDPNQFSTSVSQLSMDETDLVAWVQLQPITGAGGCSPDEISVTGLRIVPGPTTVLEADPDPGPVPIGSLGRNCEAKVLRDPISGTFWLDGKPLPASGIRLPREGGCDG
ncbi:hypothetical protein FOJ82_13420 [Tessaracoccus rhinocerotis]|uniref:Uncharacterized protein n=1 Tax=Tessaracoccus rhinocerotis TaxID=1689449 RepID=A0A553JWL1_9ACTN|nr:hypothetical protein [Tessaracoccus rhinocerotis]TRY16867.1 hypothetical protein FOJ82_13420 [Tessaracoccus rhinocerotis]